MRENILRGHSKVQDKFERVPSKDLRYRNRILS